MERSLCDFFVRHSPQGRASFELVQKALMAGIPIMIVMRVVYPVAGLIWGLIVHQAIEQGYLPLVG